MKVDSILKLIAISLIITAVGCGKNEKAQKEAALREAKVEAVAKEVEKAKKAAEEAALKAIEEPPAPVQDKHFLSIDIKKENLKTGGVLEAFVDLNVPFTNPFDSRDISVELYLNGESNGISRNCQLMFESGNQDKSTWRLICPLTKAGKYKCSFNVRAKNKNYFSLEYDIDVAKGEPSKIFKLSKKSFTHFTNSAGENIRALGVNFPMNIDIETQKTLLQRLSKSGANTIRIAIEAPLTGLIAQDTETQKAGWVNVQMFKQVEEVMNLASSMGIYTIIDFASPFSFSENIYDKSYFAKSQIAPKPADFFTSMKAQQAFNSILNYAVLRFGTRPDLLMWQIFDGIDALPLDSLDDRMSWLSGANVALRDADTENAHPILLSANTSSELEFIWSGDSCDVLAFDIFDAKDFSLAVNSHNKFFSRKYRKPIAVSKFGNSETSINLPEPSNILVHNTLWSGTFTPTPIMPLLNISSDSSAVDAGLASFKAISAFEKKFNLANANLELLPLRDVIVLAASKPEGNSFSTQPAFGKTHLSRESSNDLAELILESDGSVIKNTLPRIWVKDAFINIKVNGVPNTKKPSILSFDIVSVPQESEFDLQVMLNDEPYKTFKFSGSSTKLIREENGVKIAYINQNIKIPLEEGNQSVSFQLQSSKVASMEVANIKVDGMGSNMGVASVRPYGLRDKTTGNSYIWFKRAATDSYTYAKYKLYERSIPELKSFDFSVQVKPETSYRVTWFDTFTGEVIVLGVVKSDASSQLKMRTPAFKVDVACAIEEIKVQ